LAVKYPFTAASPAPMAACLNSRHPRSRRSTSYGSCCAGSARWAGGGCAGRTEFDLLASPTPTQRRAFELLGAPIPLTLK